MSIFRILLPHDYYYRTNPRLEKWVGELESNSNEALVPVGLRIDGNMVECRELLDCRMFLLSTLRDDTAFSRRRARPRADGRYWKQRDYRATGSGVGARINDERNGVGAARTPDAEGRSARSRPPGRDN